MLHPFYAMTMPGLETLAFSEIRASHPDAEQLQFARGIALFRTTAPPEDLLALRTTEDIFFTLAHITSLGHRPDALRVLHSATLHADITTALNVWSQAHQGAQPRTWRVVSQMSGNYHFRRVDAGQSIAAALRKALPHHLRQVQDNADLEIWLWLGGGSIALVGLRLSDASMRHRRYKREHLPASLRPTVAAAMGWLSQPAPQDRVLDPLCGAGTILIERALLGPLHTAQGGDIRAEAVAMAQRNAHAAQVALDLIRWNARALPLDVDSVTHIITNLPFGKQIGSHEENISLYTTLAQEFGRVLTPNGLLVTLTSEDRLWETVLRDHGWRTTKKVVLVVLGQPATIFVSLKKT